MVELSSVGVNCIFHGIDTAYALDLLEERHNDVGVRLYLWADLVLLADSDSFELDDDAGVDVVFGLEYNLILFVYQLVRLGLLRLYDVNEI